MGYHRLVSSCGRRSFVFSLTSGLLVGYFTCCVLQYFLLSCTKDLSTMSHKILPQEPLLNRHKSGPKSEHFTDKNLIFIGVMTAKTFLHTRAKAAYETWARSVPGTVVFFSSEGSVASAPAGLPLVGLRGVDDSYPPQKKSFMMLKYMYDRYINDYAFFMRADDDVYIKGDVLSKLLHSINSSRALFLGQAGLGNKEEYGMLHLKSKENFCMGGPGVILTRTTLARIVPHIGHCLSNLYTTHEDVELGRCVSRFAKVSCTWSYEMQKILYNNYNEPNGSFTHSLKDPIIHSAATLHPVKNPKYQYRLEQYFQSRRAADLRNELSRLQREINSVNEILQDRDEFFSPNHLGLQPSLMKFIPKTRHDVLDWDFLSKTVYSSKNVNPRRGFEMDVKLALDDIIMQVMESVNKNARQQGRSIEYRDILYGYSRVNPLDGADYILDFLLFYKRFKGKRKMTVPVRRHAYIQLPFLETEFIEDEDLRSISNLGQSSSVVAKSDVPGNMQQVERLQSEDSVELSQKNTTVNFILPLSGRYQTFLQFMQNFEDVFLRRGERVSLAVMLFRDEQDDRSDDTSQYISSLQLKYASHRLRVVQLQGMFSRALALQRGSSLYRPSDLLFFIDVDVYLHADILHRIRYNTISGKQVYYPIVFSQYDPQFTCVTVGNCSSSASAFQFDAQFGYWRLFGYGIASVFNGDLQRVGGLDKDIKGWGKEDVDLLQKFLSFNMSIFRSVDVGLMHSFHAKVCDPSLDAARYQMCLGSKAASYASVERLAEIVYGNREIFHRNEPPMKAGVDSETSEHEAEES